MIELCINYIAKSAMAKAISFNGKPKRAMAMATHTVAISVAPHPRGRGVYR